MAHPPKDDPSQDDTSQDDAAPSGAEPGAVSQPNDSGTDGPVTLGDRTEPGGQGSPDTNQAKAEPMSPTPDHPEPLAVPELADMNVGAADPQTPSRGAPRDPAPVGAAPSGMSDPGSRPDSGESHQAPGLPGTSPEGEAIDSDVDAGAARMDLLAAPNETEGQGDAGPAPAAGDGAAPGTSEEQDVVRGSRLPAD